MAKSAIFLILAIVASVRSQSECPGELSILPCVCNILDDRPSIECSQINDEDELESIFSADFPDTDIQFFTLTNSYLPRLSRNVFGNVSFDDVYIRVDYLVEISEDAFENSEETLLAWEIVNAPISQNSFPFGELDRYPRLTQLVLRNNQLTQFPEVVSENLRFLFIIENELITALPSDALATVANLTSLDLQGCGITTISNTTFRGTEQLQYLSLRSNAVSVIHAQFFGYLPDLVEINLSRNNVSVLGTGALAYLPSLVEANLGYNSITSIGTSTFILNGALENIDFIYNEISTIEPGTFDGLPRLQLVDLGYNSLERVISRAFEGANVTTLYIDYNSIDYIESNAFGNIEESYVNIMYNDLTNLYEYWLKPLLDADNQVYLTGNPVTCGCEISWLFEDPAYIDQVTARCPNGTYFAQLDPAYYTDVC